MTITRRSIHRSKVMRLALGGAVAVGLGASSSAFACTAQTVLNISDGIGEQPGAYLTGPPGSVVTVTVSHTAPDAGSTLTLAQVSGRRTSGVAAPGPVNELGRVTVTEEMVEAKTGAKVSATVTPGTYGLYYFEATYIDPTGIETKVYDGAYTVPAPAVASSEPGTAIPEPIQDLVVATDLSGDAPVNTAPAVADTKGSIPDAAIPSTRLAAVAPRRPATPTAVTSALGRSAELPTPVPAVVTPDGATRLTVLGTPLQVAPDAKDIWSGIGSSTNRPSLLDSPVPSEGGLPVGAGLLGVGLLVLAGGVAVAGDRRLAQVKRTRS